MPSWHRSGSRNPAPVGKSNSSTVVGSDHVGSSSSRNRAGRPTGKAPIVALASLIPGLISLHTPAAPRFLDKKRRQPSGRTCWTGETVKHSHGFEGTQMAVQPGREPSARARLSISRAANQPTCWDSPCAHHRRARAIDRHRRGGSVIQARSSAAGVAAIQRFCCPKRTDVGQGARCRLDVGGVSELAGLEDEILDHSQGEALRVREMSAAPG